MTSSPIEIKSRPILFSAQMVREILAGRKTQTRRVVKPQFGEGWDPNVGVYHPTKIDRHGEEYPGDPIFGAADNDNGVKCPYGAPGHTLWVRENWQTHCDKDDIKPCDLPSNTAVQYPATYDGWVSKVRPSIHMPRWASRITLEITGIRVEPLHGIDELDALAEGFQSDGVMSGTMVTSAGAETRDDWAVGSARDGFKNLWTKINGKRAGRAWDDNPWLWVISFSRVESGGAS